MSIVTLLYSLHPMFLLVHYQKRLLSRNLQPGLQLAVPDG